MLNYAQIKDDKIIGMCNVPFENILNIEVSDEIYNNYLNNPDMYIWDGLQVVVNPNYEAEQELKERERIARLNLTGADVERGIYQAKGMDFEDIIQLVTHLSQSELDFETGEVINKGIDIDVKALKIELKANHFYRGNPYVDAIGTLLGFTSEQLDKFFEYNDYTYLQ